MIVNKEYIIARAKLPKVDLLADVIQEMLGKEVIRWYLSNVTEDEITVQATLYDDKINQNNEDVTKQYFLGKNAVLSIIPTGIGCEIGGYAGDASPSTNLLATTVDYLITNPNAVNASDFIGLSNNVVYTEGSFIDLFSQGKVNLYLPYANKIGLIIDKSDDWKLDIIFNVVNAVRAVHGVDIVDYVITSEPIASRCCQNKAGAFVGTVDNPLILLEACEKLINKGANAIAVTSNVQDLPLENYAKHFTGEYPNPVGGVEAVISHLIAKTFQIPTAHAPLLNIKQLDLVHNIVDARGSGEMTSISGLACILIGLKKAPQLRTQLNNRIADIININNLLAVVMPASSLGGVPVLYAQKYGIPVIAVGDNRTILNVTQEKLQLNNVVQAHSYAEAAGIILSLKHGIDLGAIFRPLKTLRY
ncbi:MAG: DUF3326 domain-containing protein [Tolypothrix brevis GSE-NOS-MK-07-07A]|jgi:hypothetical protein|nr:DUF3326 domain-containing protein [Tolypothrix brevis GSE-NOS-MK-07-07A]